MYMDSGFLTSIEDVIICDDSELTVTSCGFYKIDNNESLTTYRRHGRKDFQIIYIQNGTADFNVNNCKIPVREGSVVVIYPDQKQQYEYKRNGSTDVYWLHFSGYKAEAFLKDVPFDQNGIINLGMNSDFSNIFKKIIRELQHKDVYFEQMCQEYFKELLLLFKRQSYNSSNCIYKHYALIKTIEQDFIHNYNLNIQINEYAKKYNVSTCWFIRIFKSKTGISPQAYINEIRIQKSKEYLLSSDFNISQISNNVGFENPMYFSRLFKIKTGISPSGYRKLYSI